MKKNIFAIFCLFLLSFVTTGSAQEMSKPLTLPNGWSISPVGKSFPLGDLPLNIAVSHSGKMMAVTNNGQSTQSIQLIDVKSERVIDSVVIPKSWFGLAFTNDDHSLYVSGGHDNRILRYVIDNGKIKLSDTIQLNKPWPVRVGPAGIALDESRKQMYVVTREDKSLYIVDLETKKVKEVFGLEAEAYDVKLSSKRNELYISCWGCDQVLVFDLQKKLWKQPIRVGDNPNEMLLADNGKYLYVCNANDNSVSLIDLDKRVVIETLDAAL